MLLQCPSDERTVSKSPLSRAWKKTKKIVSSATKAEISLSPIRAKHRQSPKKAFPTYLPGRSARIHLSPRKSPRKSLSSSQPTSPIDALRSLTSIQEERTESNDLSVEEKETDAAYTLQGVPTDEMEIEQEDGASQGSISKVLSRISVRVSKDSEADAVPSGQQQQANKVQVQYATVVDPIYDCVGVLCGDEDIGKVMQKTKATTPTKIYSGGNWEERIIVGDAIDTTAADASSQVSESTRRSVDARQEGPNLGIELVYFDDTCGGNEKIKDKPSDEDEGASSKKVSSDGDTYGFSKDDTFGFPKEYVSDRNANVIPQSISFVESPTKDNALNESAAISKAVSYHDGGDLDQLLEAHPVQSSLWMQIQEVRRRQERLANNASPNFSTVANTGTGRDKEEYCESMSTAEEEEETTTVTTSRPRTQSNYDEIVATLLAKTKTLLDAIQRFEYETYRSVTTDDVTGFLEDGKLVQGRQFHCYYSLASQENAKTSRITKSKVQKSFLDQVPLHQSVSSPTVRLVSSNVAVVSYLVKRKVLEKGKIVETELAETRVWEKRQDNWLNCHFHISKCVVGGGGENDGAADSSTMSSSQQQKSTSTATTSSSAPYYD
ncbi:MAG: hypothetical protein SGARI_001705 [Bacillariaceae sp.]